jgi:hypothetical protein
MLSWRLRFKRVRPLQHGTAWDSMGQHVTASHKYYRVQNGPVAQSVTILGTFDSGLAASVLSAASVSILLLTLSTRITLQIQLLVMSHKLK